MIFFVVNVDCMGHEVLSKSELVLIPCIEVYESTATLQLVPPISIPIKVDTSFSIRYYSQA